MVKSITKSRFSDPRNKDDLANLFRTVGYGHSKEVWNNIISTLKAVGYDGAISIEHEALIAGKSAALVYKAIGASALTSAIGALVHPMKVALVALHEEGASGKFFTLLPWRW